MARQHRYRVRFDAPPAAVSARFAEPAYYRHKHQAIGASDIAEQPLPAERADVGMRVRYSMKVSASVPLPGSVRKLLGGTLTVTQTDQWDAVRRSGSIEVEVAGLPIRARARTRLEDAGSQAEVIFDWTVNCGIPLVGGAVERLVAEDIESRSRLESVAFA